MTEARREIHTTVACAHPYFGYVSTPHATIDFSDRVPAEFGHGAVATIDGHGFRNDGLLSSAKPDDELWIGMFGGSVAFGVPATDNGATIAGCLERVLNRGPRRDGRRVRVVSFAIPGGQQPQSLFVLLWYRHLLDGAITFDGVNEVVVPACYNKDFVPPQFPYRPYYELLFGRHISDEQICETVLVERSAAAFRQRPGWQQRLLAPFHAREMTRRRSRLASLAAAAPEFRSIFGAACGASAAAVAADGARSWAEHIVLMHEVCRAQSIDALFVVQPVPDRGKPLTAAERVPLAEQADIVAIRAGGYARVLDHARELGVAGRPILSFEDVFAACPQAIYTDVIHFEDRGSCIVADRMAERIRQMWAGFAA